MFFKYEQGHLTSYFYMKKSDHIFSKHIITGICYFPCKKTPNAAQYIMYYRYVTMQK